MARTRAKSKIPPLGLSAPSNLAEIAPSAGLLAEIRGLISDRDVKKAVETIRGALDATQNVRAPRGPSGANDYERAPDWNARLTAVRILLAYRFGQAPTHAEVHVHDHSQPPGVAKTVEDTIEELIETGADLQKIIGAYVGALKPVAEAESSRNSPSESCPGSQPVANLPQIPENAEVFDV